MLFFEEGGDSDGRKNTKEPIPAKGMPECPQWLLAEAKKEWDESDGCSYRSGHGSICCILSVLARKSDHGTHYLNSVAGYM